MTLQCQHPAKSQGGRRWCHGASMVEFALVAPLFFFLLWALFSGVWYVLEVSAITNAVREAASWEIAGSNFTPVGGSPQPYCTDSANPLPTKLVQAAAATAGPLSQAVDTAAATGHMTNTAGSPTTCTVTITVPYTPLTSLVPIGSSSVTSSSTASWS